jgi:serine/threonine protein kinase
LKLTGALQEVSIMRKVRHKHVVQFIGACTRQPNLCILVEYMSGGSVYDYMRRNGLFMVSKVVEIALMVAKGARFWLAAAT